MVLSVNDPVAVNCCAVPTVIMGVAGVTAIEANTAEVTVRVVVPLTAPAAAVIVAVPVLREVTKPLELTLAIEAFEDDQVTLPVTSWVVPSLNDPVAVSCWVLPAAIEGAAGVTEINSRFGVFGVLLPPQAENTATKAIRSQ